MSAASVAGRVTQHTSQNTKSCITRVSCGSVMIPCLISPQHTELTCNHLHECNVQMCFTYISANRLTVQYVAGCILAASCCCTQGAERSRHQPSPPPFLDPSCTTSCMPICCGTLVNAKLWIMLSHSLNSSGPYRVGIDLVSVFM